METTSPILGQQSAYLWLTQMNSSVHDRRNEGTFYAPCGSLYFISL